MSSIDTIIKKSKIFPEIWRTLNGDFSPEIKMNLKKAEIKTLMQIKFNEGQPMSFYCSKVDLEHGSFTYLTDKLESKGLTERDSDDGDRRIKILRLTEKGRFISDEIHRQFGAHLSVKLHFLDEDELNQLTEVMDVLERLQLSIASKIK
jgi:MarR family 2-MHQ and catechol resistance regulon transcriptional repressor